MMGKWQRLVVVLLVAAALVAVGVWAFWPKPEAQTGTEPTANPTSSPSSTASPPAEAELQAIEASIASGDAAAVLQLMGEPTDGTVAPETLAQLKAMAIKFDMSTLTRLGDGPAWELTAKDSSGQSWRVGLVRPNSGQLVVAYEEPAQ
ncbi:hypothetical protein A5N17_06655 [Arthrobacter sp. D2]|nr:hypothetical protein A5N13_15675 [Arthrobacter sp. D4]OEH64119.1 hypothetical protein A5N17_06655 [Arthrobacter sp. D2]